MASITMDIKAQVVGYEASLEKLRQALTKLDPGSEIRKSIERAIDSASKEIKSLGKNMTPKISSDSQIDAIITKVNSAGEAIQNIVREFSKLSIENLDLSQMGDEFNDLTKQISSLQDELNTKLNEGLREAISNSSELNDIFKRIGTDVSSADSKTLFTELSNEATKAKEAVKEAEAEVENLSKTINKYESTKAQLESSPLGTLAGKQDLDNQVKAISAQYETAFSELREKMQAGLTSLGATDLQSDKILNSFFSGLTPDTLREKIDELFNNVSAEGLTEKKTEMYQSLFGISGNINAVIKGLDLEKVFETVKLQLSDFVERYKSQLTGGKAASIKELISKDSIDEAARNTLKAIEAAFKRVQNGIQTQQDKITSTTSQLSVANERVTSAKGNEANVTDAERILRENYDRLELENKSLQDRITKLETEVQALLSSKLSTTQAGASQAGDSAKQLTLGARAASLYKTELERVADRERLIGKIQGVVQRWFSIYAAVRMVSNAIKSVISTVKELDKTITEIAIVTKMDQSDLWDQMDSYTTLARKYAASIAGVYQVSQLYYQQGLGHNDVMALTEQTLKMARISGLDYAEATDYMTNAVRSFKMEMTEAQRVVDVYSAVAASSATNVTELASAMSKTASSAQAVGASFENTTAMMAVMIEATRESAENIGSALKSIISRYGELKENKTGIDSEGEEYSLNKVDKALQSVGLSIHDANGEFREFDEVIMELAEKWDTIDTNTQRYIATIMAGNRQQSRFLALVSSYDRLKALSEEAADSENAAQLQFLKTLDSVDAKTQQLQTSLQALYVDSGIENLYKGILDIANNIVTTFTNMPTFMSLPIPAIAKFGLAFTNLATLVTTAFGLLKNRVSAQIKLLSKESVSTVQTSAQQSIAATEEEAAGRIAAMEKYYQYRRYQELRASGLSPLEISKLSFMHTGTTFAGINSTAGNKGKTEGSYTTGGITRGMALGGLAASLAGMIVSGIADNIGELTQTQRNTKGVLTIGSTALQGLGLGLQFGGAHGAALGAIAGAIMGISQSLSIFEETAEEKINNLNSVLEETNNNKIKSEAEFKTLKDYKKKIKELSKTKDYDEDSRQDWITLNAEIVENYPELLAYIDEEGNKIADLGEAYDELYNKKKSAYESDWLKNIQATIKAYNDSDYVLREKFLETTNLKTSERTTGFSRAFGSMIIGVTDADKASWVEQDLGRVNELFNQANGDIEKFKQLISEAFGQSYESLKETWLSGDATHKEWRRYQDLFTQLSGGANYKIGSDLSVKMGQYLDYIETNMGYLSKEMDRQMTSNFAEMVNYYGEEMDFSEFGVLKDQAVRYLNSKWKQVQMTAKDPAEAMESFMNEVTNYLTEFNSTINYSSSKKLAKANDIFTNKGNYSQNTLQDIINGTSEYSEYFDQEQKTSFQEYIKKNIESANNALNAIFTDAIDNNTYSGEIPTDLISDFISNMSDVPFRYWDSYLNSISSILASGNYAKSDKNKVVEQISSLNAIIEKSTLSEDDQSKAYKLVSSTDFTSLESLFDLQESLKNLGINFDLGELTKIIIPNIVTEYDRFTKKISEDFKEFEKILSSASKGMDLSSALEVAEKLNISFSDSDFSFKNGKYYFSNADRLKEAYVKQNQELYDSLNQAYDKQIRWIYQRTAINDTTILNEISSLEEIPTVEEIAKTYNIDEAIATQLLNWYNGYFEEYNTALNSNKIEVDTSFSSYVASEIAKSKENLESAIKQYGEYTVNAALITSGHVSAFLQNIDVEAIAKRIRQQSVSGGTYHISWEDALTQAQGQIDSAMSQILAGNWNSLPEDIKPYISLLMDFVKDSNKNVIDAAISSIKGQGQQVITVNEANKDILESLLGETLEIEDEVIIDFTKENIQAVKEAIRSSNLTNEQKAEVYSELHEIEFPDIVGSLEGIITNGEISYSAAANFVESLGRQGEDVAEVMAEFGFTLNTLTGQWRSSGLALYNIKRKIQELEKTDSIANKEEIDKLYALLDSANRQDQRTANAKAFTDVFSSYEKITTDMVAALATTLGIAYEEVVQWYLTDNGNGTYSLNKDEVLDLLAKGKHYVGEALYSDLLEYVAEFYDEGLSTISAASSYVSTGTTKISDMQKFVTEYNKKLNTEYQISDMFHWDDILNAYALNPEYIRDFISAQREELVAMGMSNKQIDDYIENATLETMASTVDLEAFISATNKTTSGLARKTLKSQLDNFVTLITKRSESTNAVWLEAQRQIWNETGTDHTSEDINQRAREIADANKEFNSKWSKYQGKNSDQLIALLEHGGQAAVDFAKLLAEASGEELSAEQIESIYKNKFNSLSKALDSLEGIERGDIIDTATRDILNRLRDWDVSADGVVKEVGNLIEAYTAIYEEMKHTAGKTTSELNATYAKILNQQENADIDAIETLGSAMGMTYDQLGILLGEYGKSLERVMDNPSQYGLKQIGGGKVQINDFNMFADYMNWDQNSEEYISAFKQYNDSLIEYNNRIKTEIKGEFDSLVEAKPDTQINFTRFVTEYGEDAIKQVVEEYGAVLTNGILTITDETNLTGLVTALGQIATSNGNILATEVQATIDQLKQQSSIDLTNSLTDLVQNYNQISMEAIRNYASATKTNYDDVLKALNPELNGDGTYEINLAGLSQLIQSKKSELSEEVYDSLMAEIAAVSDSILDAISTATTYSTTGTTSQKAMADFTKIFNDLTGKTLEQNELFNYNNTLKTFILSNESFSEYIKAQAGELSELGMSEDDINYYLREQIVKTTQQNLDIQGYLQSTQRGSGTLASNTLKEQIKQVLFLKGENSLDDTLIDTYVQRIEAGGLEAVEAIRELKGAQTTSEELESALNAGMNRLNTAISDLEKGVGEVVTEDTAKILRVIHGYSFTSIGNGQYVINSVGNMVAAYAAIYHEMENTANHTTADLNNLYAQYVTASAQKNVDIRDTLQNAFDMPLDTFNQLLEKYSPNTLLKDILENAQSMADWGLEQTIFGTLNITNFDAFARQMRWEKGSKEFLDAYNTYVDGLITNLDSTSEKTIQQHFNEQVQAITQAKPGSSVNVSYISEAFGKLTPQVNKVFEKYGARIENGILRLSENADIPGITAEILNIAEQTRSLLPDQLAELRDTLISAIQNITATIKKGISGSLTNVEALDLTKWAESQGLKGLDFTQTADGLQLTADSIANVYSALKAVDAVQAQSLLPDIQSANASFSSFTSTLQALEGQEERNIRRNQAVTDSYVNLSNAINSATIKGTVETDYNLRPHVVDEEGFTETYFSSSFSDELERTVLLTPILPDGSKLSDDGLQQVADKYLSGEIELDTKLVGDDGKELDATLKDIFMGLYDNQDAAEAAAEAYHEYHDAIMEAKSGTDSLNDSLNNSTELMRDLVSSMLTDPDNFNFMDNDLPDAMQSVVNTYESAYTAMDSLTTASSDGYMGLQDFYNIITTSSTLMEAAGKEFSVKGKTAAQLMSEVGDSLVVVDGKLSVDISGTGMDLVGNIDELKSNLTEGIHSLAQAEIDMLDAEIAVLEIFAAMESLGEVDVDSDGISFEIEDIFDFNNASGWTTEFQTYLTQLQGIVDASEEATAAAKSIKINGISFYDLLRGSWEDWKNAGFTQETLSQFFQTVYNTDWTAFNGDLQQGIASILNSLGIPISVAIDGGMYHFNVSQRTFDFQWDDEATMTAAADAIKRFYSEELSGGQLQSKIEEVYSRYSAGWQEDGTNTLEWEELWQAEVICNVASGNFNVKTNDNKTWYGTYNNTTFKGDSEEKVQELIAQAMAYQDKGYTFEYEYNDKNGESVIKGTKKIGAATINIEYDQGKEKITTSEDTEKSEYNSVNEAVEDLIELGFSNKDQVGYTFQGGHYEVKADASLGVNYTYDYVEDKIIYNGNNFKSYDDFANYVAIVEPLKSREGWTIESNDDFTIYTNESANIEQNMSTGEITYISDGITFKSGEDYASYVAAKELSKSSEGTISTDDSGSIVTYRLSNKEITLEVDAHGNMKYSFSVGGVLFTAESEAGIKQALADYNFFQDDGEETISNTGSDAATYTVTKDNVQLEVRYNADGVKVKSSDETAEGAGQASNIEEQLNTKFQTELNNITPKATVSGLELSLDSNAQIGLAEGADTGLELSEPIEKVTGILSSMELEPTTEALGDVKELIEEIDKATPEVEIVVDKDESAIQHLESLGQQIDALGKKTPQVEVKVDPENNVKEEQIPALTEEINKLSSLPKPQPTVDLNVGEVQGQVKTIQELINSIQGTSVSVDVSYNVGSAPSILASGMTSGVSNIISNIGGGGATGNIGLAKAKGTLMGELGPELVVSNGRYFVAGQDGAEFVNLANDAIVFNHLQTEQLLKNGTSATRGKAITNERNAIAFARGNMGGGDAMMNASAALAQLKAIRSMWQSLLNSSVKDLAGTGGSGGGGGGGGSDDSAAARNSYIADVERWYNWLQRIAVLEEKINEEEIKRSKYSADLIARGKEYAESNLQTLKYLKEQASVDKALSDTQQEYFNKRRTELNNGAFSKLYTFDKYGQLRYNDEATINGNKGGFAFLSDLMTRDDYGKPKYSSEEQYNILVAAGFGDYMKYDSSGTEILQDEDSDDQSSFYSSSVQAFFDVIDSQKEEMQSLHDSIQEYSDAVIENQEAAFEIIKEIEDNQIAVEQRVYNALVDLKQRAIDELQDQRDVIEESSNKLINGLTEQLNREKDLYAQNESTSELQSLQRQLSILQNSGGSASQIASLQKEIQSKQRDMYYEMQQAQIDALQEASDNELEKLDEEIDLMTETLEYQKEHGLLWKEVADIMRGSPTQIADYIKQNDSDFWGKSPTQTTQEYRDALFEAQQFVTYRDNVIDGISGLAQQFSDFAIQQAAEEEKENNKVNIQAAEGTGSGGSGNSDSGGGSSSSGGGSGTSSSSSGGSSSNNSNNTTAWKYDDRVSGRMYEVDAGGKATGAIKYDDTGLANINTPQGQQALEAARNRETIKQEETKIDAAKSASTTAQLNQKAAQTAYNNATTDSGRLAAAQSIAAAQSAQAAANKQISTSNSTIKNLKNNIKATTKASGGYVGHGIYELGELGTETVLTAQQTKILRDNILSDRPNSLISLLKSYNEGYSGINDAAQGVQPVEDNSVVIEQAIVEMHVTKMSNDYDAQRAGEQALEKMLTIARKTSAQNRIGR